MLEHVVMRDGVMANAQLTNYIIPTTLDVPKMDVVILEKPYAFGPFGAKGVGEMPIDGPAPAVINALRHAGVDLRQIPATPGNIPCARASSFFTSSVSLITYADTPADHRYPAGTSYSPSQASVRAHAES